ncbi:MAG: hypothetical protein FWE27_00740 [Defluviitaleaceae bacterium]|nr:hypothetical protein [Defluviitaleaceae bacterium]
MKRVWILAIIMVAVLAFAACGGNEPASTTPTNNNVAEQNEVPPVQDVDVNGNGDEEPPVEINDQEEPPVEGNGDEEPPVDGNDEEPPVDGNGDEEPPVDGNGDEEPPVDGNGDEEPATPVEPESTSEAPAPTEAPVPTEAPAPPVTAAAGPVVYSLATDVNFQELEVGHTDRGQAVTGVTWYLMNAGNNFDMTVIAAPGGHKGFRVHNRTRDSWDQGVDFMREEGDADNPPWDMNTGANTYRLQVNGIAPAGTNMIITAGDNPWNHLFMTEAGADGRFSFDEDVSNNIFRENVEIPTDPPGREVTQFNRGFRVVTFGAPLVDYEIHDFIITRR